MILKNTLLAIINNFREICYVSDIETYEILFLNDSAKKNLGITDENYIGEKCYKVWHNKDEQCSFCTNAILKKDEVHSWEFYNEVLKKHYSLRDTVIEVDGRLVRLEFAIDITDKVKELEKVKKMFSFEKALLRCTKTLLTQDDINIAINTLLSIVCEYHKGSRAYIFENDDDNKQMHNTYEWCKDGIKSERDNLQNFPQEIIKRWTNLFKKEGELFISSVEQDCDHDSIEYEMLKEQRIKSLVAVPLKKGDKTVGFLGIDNPTINISDTRFLKAVTLFIMDDFQKRRLSLNYERLSYIDTMTGVFNRNKYLAVLEEYQKKPPAQLGIVFVDVNSLKKINDTYGHTYGDHVICISISLIQRFFPDNIFRVGGDEFVCFVVDMDKETFTKQTEDLRKAALKEDNVSISIGCMWNTDIVDIEKQIAKADNLMYIEKQKYYRSVLSGETTPRIGMAQSLVDAVKNNEFIVYLQPMVNLENREVVSAEALVRQKAPDGSLIFPDKFISIYEEEGVISFIDLFVLEKVCQTIAEWKKKGVEIPIAVNFSRITLMEHNIVDSIVALCDKYEVDHRLIEIEVTERVGNLPEEILENLMHRLKEEEFKVTLDDFGSEYSNLVSLANMDFQEVKMDKSLVDRLLHNKKNQVILQSVIDMCNSFKNTTTLAEGVENAEQAKLLAQYKCNRGQGYLFSKPVSISEFYDLFAADFKK